MSEVEFGGFTTNHENESADNTDLIEKIEEAFKVYKQCEGDLNDLSGDYGELKIARLRLEFARHELIALMKEANEKGISWEKNHMAKDIFSLGSNDNLTDIKENGLENNEL